MNMVSKSTYGLLDVHDKGQRQRSNDHNRNKGLRLIGCALLSICLLCILASGITDIFGWLQLSSINDPIASSLLENSVCPQVEPAGPSAHKELFQELDALFRTNVFRLHPYESLGGVVRVPTETQDDEKSPSEDPEHWRPFGKLHTYLESRFPLMYSNLNVTKVNLFALVFHWQGSDVSLKPILLTSHQDVVPVETETVSQWRYLPYSGYFDGEYIWGRGSCDDKSGLIASMTAVETLLSSGFQPERTIVLAMGIDEEGGGIYGAGAIGEYLLTEYGESSFSILVDEGGGYSHKFGATFATPAVAEKGYLDVQVQVSTPGGHSSQPPSHTSIGMLSHFITELEANSHPTVLKRNTTYYHQLQCLAEHAPSLPSELSKLIKASLADDGALSRLAAELKMTFPEFGPSTGTTQAVDIIHGGVKSNALPEQAYAIVNHRIADDSSVSELQDRFASIVSPLAKDYNLSVDAFGDEKLSTKVSNAYGHLALLEAYDSGLEPAPVTPTFGSSPWELLSGSILYALATNQRSPETNDKYFVAPSLSLGNTGLFLGFNTRFYWNLTRHIFRYGHLGASDGYNGAHTVNEAVRAEGFLELIRFFTVFILNADETNLLD